MYNGIGLQTARGSCTNGHVQSNKFFIQPRAKAPLHGHGDGAARMRRPNKEILEHDRGQQTELCMVELRDTFEEHGCSEAEIEQRVKQARKEAELEAAGGGAGGAAPRPGEGVSHHVAARKEKKLEALRTALGLDAEVGQKKKAEVDSDLESGELIPRKDGF
ncbi:hypothetical protein ZWY2020_051955 [Hordeum vulgare]|nr:hypothetical protein ZWY2020_051955 [Hordeum vulgare]